MKIINKWSKFAVLILAAVAGVLFVVVRAHQPAPPPPPLPNPNGYDDFLKAAQLVVDVRPEVLDGDLAKLAEAVEQNKEALRLVRLGLSRECRVPVQFTKTYEQAWIANLNPLRSLAWALVAEGMLAELQGRYSDALVSYSNCVRLGNGVTQGGLIIDKMFVENACDAHGLKGIQRIHIKIRPTELREAIRTLQTVDAQREPIGVIIKRDAEFSKKVYRWWENLSAQLEYYHTIFRSEVERELQESLTREEAKFRLGIIDLAIKLHRLQTGHLPARLRDLVPASISQLPEDPFNPGGFIYRTNATGYLLYSIGPDGKDDGGAKLVVPDGKGIPKGDILPE